MNPLSDPQSTTASDRQFSDVVLDLALLLAMGVADAAGLGLAAPLGLAVMVGLAIARKTGNGPLYRKFQKSALRYPVDEINASAPGRHWARYLELKAASLKDKESQVVGRIRRIWYLYGLGLGAAAYWCMPVILAFAGSRLQGQGVLVLALIVLHIFSVFGQYAEVKAWHRRKTGGARG